MNTSQELRNELRAIDHKSYPAYKNLRGSYRFDGYELGIDHVQGDPFAAPSSVSIRMKLERAGFSAEYAKSPVRRNALADYLLRQFAGQVEKYNFKAKGSGKSGLISVVHCGQERLIRSDCEVSQQMITLRFAVGFPANGRTINARELEKILFDFLPECVEQSLYLRNLNQTQLKEALYLAEDQEYIRSELKKRELVAFVANDAILPRESGVSQRPMKQAKAFQSPASMEIELMLPHRGRITGMGVRKGIALIVGGGYHGKSTLLTALQLGVYDHIRGDGREYVITDETAIKMRSEDGRFIKDVDISMFIKNLPNGKDTVRFSTEDASGSTSQAAAIVEGMEAGGKVILLDEDTSATNFMVRDAFMQQVVSPDQEPITPFLMRARELYEKAGMSTVLVAGSSGAFFHIADTILQMDGYACHDITERAKKLCEQFPLADVRPAPVCLPDHKRIMSKDQNGAAKRRDYRTGRVREDGREQLKVKTGDVHSFMIGKQNVDLRYMEQLVDREQTATLALLLKYVVEQLTDGKRTVADCVQMLEEKLKKEGLDFLADRGTISGGYAIPRRQEIFACLNHYRRN